MLRMSRRDFLKTGAQGLAVASLPLVFRVNPVKAFMIPAGGQGTLGDYYSHFGVDEQLIREIMAAALEKGGDYCDLYFQHSLSNSIGLEDDVVNRAFTSVDYGVGIRVVEGDQTGYSFTEEITPESMKLAARTAANIAAQSKNIPPQGLEYLETPNYYPVNTFWSDVKIDRKIPLLQKVNDRIKSLDNRVIKSTVYYADDSSYVLIATSDGRVACDFRPMAYISSGCTAEQNGRREQNGFSFTARDGFDFFTPDILERLSAETVQRTTMLFDAIKPEGGEMEVVLAAGSSGILLHEAIGHGLEADFNRKGTSIFSDKMGKKVAEKFVNVIDNGTNPHIRGTLNVDDEANPTEETYLVKDGILVSYIHDRISAAHYKVKPTGNGRRESFRFSPIPRMRNTYMSNGPHSKEEIIRSVKKGLYAEDFTNGQVLIGPGDFTFYVKSGALIEDGKITRPVKDVNIIGNGPDVLSKIVMAGDDFKMSEGGWTCGKGGQGVPVSQGLPTVKVSSITVGGVS